MLQKTLIGGLIFVFGVWGFNTSIFTPPPEQGQTRLLAHRGVHQTYDKTGGVGLQECTATRIFEPTHEFLENTIPSIRVAFEAGADVVEIDIRMTQDGHFAVFHDWGLGCRANEQGKIETFTRDELKQLDIGYGYTADGGQTYPFRGKHIGAMPMLDEIVTAFPEGRFLINLKANNHKEGTAFAAFITAHPEWADNVFGFYGGPKTVASAKADLPGLTGFLRRDIKTCLTRYALLGWTGYMPDTCHNTQILLPISHAKYLWGWPHTFTNRMKAAGTDVYLAGIYPVDDYGSSSIDTVDMLARVPSGFDGFIWTDRIEVIGPLLKGAR